MCAKGYFLQPKGHARCMSPGGAQPVCRWSERMIVLNQRYDDFQQMPKGFILVEVSSVSRFIDLLQRLVFQ